MGWEDVEGITKALSPRALWHQKESRTCCQEILWRPVVASDIYSLLEGHQLRFNSCHCQLAYKNDTLQADAENY